MQTVASFHVGFTRYLEADGRPAGERLPLFAREVTTLLPLYRLMVITRAFDTRAIALQRTGQLGTYPSCLGQEAVGAGVGTAMHPDDVLVPTYREQAAQFARGVSLAELLRYWGGDERGSDFAGPREDFPVCVPVGTQAGHAAGVAAAFRLRGEQRVAVCMMGDGATSRGDVYEAMNAAGAWKLPVVFVVCNNEWAISVPRHAQTAATTLAQKAIAAGIAGEQVDGNDVIAVRDGVDRALARARSGSGPTVLEALSYRLQDHTTADDATRYRDDEELSARWKLDPLVRLRTYLTAQKAWSHDDEERLHAECAQYVQIAVDEYLATPPQAPGDIFDHLYATLPRALAGQREEALAGDPQEASTHD